MKANLISINVLLASVLLGKTLDVEVQVQIPIGDKVWHLAIAD